MIHDDLKVSYIYDELCMVLFRHRWMYFKSFCVNSEDSEPPADENLNHFMKMF